MAAGGDAFKICCRRCEDKGWLYQNLYDPVTNLDIEEPILCPCQIYEKPKPSLFIKILNWVFS
jgi:hypothetical protein